MKVFDKIKKIDKKKLIYVVVSVVFVFVLLFMLNLFFIWKSTCKYNKAARSYNQLSEEYDDLVTNTNIDNIIGVSKSYGTIEIVDEGLVACIRVIFSSNNAIKIGKDTKTILKYCKEIEMMLVVIEQITGPETNLIESKLNEIEYISGTEIVTEDKNPDGLLNKDGGYVGCIYFSLKEIDQTTVPGDSIVEKGTDCGGSIEIYSSLEEAEARCEYLAGFDGTILYSGSYAIVGTTVIRTSYKLSNERQLEITSAVTKKLTEVK